MRPVFLAIPAFNEAQGIEACVRAALGSAAAAGMRPVAVVADDTSTDGTPELASAAGARVVEVEYRQIAAVRNAAGRAALVEEPGAPDDLLVFIDGDTLISGELLAQARDALAAGAIGGGARTRFDEAPRWARWMFLILVGPLLWWRGYAGGCFLYCRRDAFDAIGGFDERYYAAEEIHFLKALKKLKRGNVRILKAASMTSGRKVRQYSPWQLMRVVFTVARTQAKKREGLELWYSGEREKTSQNTA